MTELDDEDDERSTVLRSAIAPSPALSAIIRLRVSEGPDRGKLFDLDAAAERVLIGQSPSCSVRLADPSVSRRHASIELCDGGLLLTDLGSKNGTWVEGVSIVAAHVRGGERVRLGGTTLSLEASALVPASVPPPARASFGRVVGASTEMRRLYPLFERLAQTGVPVVIEGETGTGKEALAEAIHEQGPRSSGPFVVFDCTAVAPSLLEAELFGHERGAFTGASASRRGLFEQASGGTLLIDEIGELPLELQPKLLRAIERSEIRRVGGDRVVKVDVRLVAATRRDLDAEVARGRFRDDLFHRLSVVRVELPPLRRRKGDVPVLAAHFWQALGGEPRALPAALVRRWAESPWPGNVRELRNAVARHLAIGDLEHAAGALADEPVVPGGNGDDAIGRVVAEGLPLPVARAKVLEEFRARYLAAALARHGGNVTRAAAASGVAVRYFQILRAGRRGGGG